MALPLTASVVIAVISPSCIVGLMCVHLSQSSQLHIVG